MKKAMQEQHTNKERQALLPKSITTASLSDEGKGKHSTLYASTDNNQDEDMMADMEAQMQQGVEENIDSNGNQSESKNESVGDQILSLAIPALAALAIDPLMTLADTAFIGRFSTDSAELSGMGSAAALLTFSFYIFNFLCTATTPLVSMARSQQDEEKASSVGGQALSLAAFMGITLCAILLVFQQPLLNIMGTEYTGDLANSYADDFLRVRALAAPAVFLCSAATGILRGYLDTKTAIIVLAGANAVNLSLDVVLIAGMGLGPLGAAIATTTAEWMSAIIYLLILAGKLPSTNGLLGSNQNRQVTDEVQKISIENKEFLSIIPTFSIPKWTDVKPLIVASSSVFLRTVILQLFLSSATSVIARGSEGSDGVAAHQIAIQLWLLCSFVCDALAAASQALVADKIGQKDAVGVRNICQIVFGYSVILGLALAVFLGVGTSSGILLGFFTSDPSIQAELRSIMPLIIVAQPLNSLVFAADGILQGASEFAYQAKTMWISVAGAVLCYIANHTQYFGGLLDSSSTLVNVWISILVLQSLRGFTSYLKVVDDSGPIRLTK